MRYDEEIVHTALRRQQQLIPSSALLVLFTVCTDVGSRTVVYHWWQNLTLLYYYCAQYHLHISSSAVLVLLTVCVRLVVCTDVVGLCMRLYCCTVCRHPMLYFTLLYRSMCTTAFVPPDGYYYSIRCAWIINVQCLFCNPVATKASLYRTSEINLRNLGLI